MNTFKLILSSLRPILPLIKNITVPGVMVNCSMVTTGQIFRRPLCSTVNAETRILSRFQLLTHDITTQPARF